MILDLWDPWEHGCPQYEMELANWRQGHGQLRLTGEHVEGRLAHVTQEVNANSDRGTSLHRHKGSKMLGNQPYGHVQQAYGQVSTHSWLYSLRCGGTPVACTELSTISQ